MIYPDEIKEIRRKLGLTQREFAKKAGVAVSTVARWEIGMIRPSPLALLMLSKLEQEANRQ